MLVEMGQARRAEFVVLLHGDFKADDARL